MGAKIKYSLEERIQQLFRYWQDRVPVETVATAYNYESYNHQSAAKGRRDAIAMEQAHRQAMDEVKLGIEKMGEGCRECAVCGFVGNTEEWGIKPNTTVKCPKCENTAAKYFRYTLRYEEEK